MKNSNQPAFGYHENYEYHQNGDGLAFVHKSGGLTKLEYLSGLAMQGLLSNAKIMADFDTMIEKTGNDELSLRVISVMATNTAKALLAELEKETANQSNPQQ